LVIVVIAVMLINNQGQKEPVALISIGSHGEAVREEDNHSASAGSLNDELIETGTIAYLGGTYTGQLKNGLPHGEGSLIYEVEQTSAGLVQRGERKYDGQWLDGQMHGEGVMTYPDGTKRIGIWENNNFIGR